MVEIAHPVSAQGSGDRRESDLTWMLLIFLSLLTLYWSTAPRTVVLEDDGLFILSSWFLGVEHPPGYPLFVLLGKLATLVPIGSPAWRVHALSGLLAALACLVVYRIARQLIPGRTPALLAALGLGVSQTYWSQALIADVYSLHALIFFSLLYWAITERITPCPSPAATDTRLTRTALITGLGIANHWPLLLLSAPGLLLLWWPNRQQIARRLIKLTVLLSLGLLPYAWMLWRSQQQPEISFFGPIDSWPEFLDYFLRRTYADVDASSTAGLADRIQYLALLLRLAGEQLLLPGVLLALLGALGQWRQWGALISGGMTLAFLGPTLVLTLLLGFDYDPQMREVYRVYPLPAWGILALWAGLGLHLLVLRISRSRLARRRSVRTEHLGAGLATLLILSTLAAHWHRNDRHGDWLAQNYARTLLDSAAPGSIFLAAGEAVIPATGYLHLIEQVRPDLLLISEPGLVLEPRLFDPRHTSPELAKRITDANLQATGTPVYRLHNRDGRSGNLNWIGFQLDPASEPNSRKVKLTLGNQERRFLRRLVTNGPFADGWSELLRRALLEDFAVFFTRAELSGDPLAKTPELLDLFSAIITHPDAALARARLLARAKPSEHRLEIERLLTRVAQQIDDPWLNKDHLARYFALADDTASATLLEPKPRPSRNPQ